MPKKSLSQARLREVLYYNRDTGVFTWIKRLSNRVKIGSDAGTVNRDGYRIITIDGFLYRAHRLAFLYMTGELPPHDVDHEIGDKDDNRWSKIRLATRRQNARNQKRRCTNKSGATGVYWNNKINKWTAYIGGGSGTIHLGCFTDFNDAVAARKQADIKYGYDKNHGR